MADKKYVEIMSNGMTVVEYEDPERIRKEKRRKRLNMAAKIGIGVLAFVGAGTLATAAYSALTYVPDGDSDEDNQDDQEAIDVTTE